MQDLMSALYRYIQENQVMKYLRTSEYHQATSGLEEGWEGFRSTLTEAQLQTLDALLAQEGQVERLEDTASFAAGISIGMTLGRL